MHSIIGRSRLYGALVCGLLGLASIPGGAMAEGRTLTAQDYAQAEKYMPYNTMPLVDHAVETVHWLDGTHFWYVDHDAAGDHYMRMDAANGKASPLFDQTKLAAALVKAGDKNAKADKLHVMDYRVAADGRDDIVVGGKHYLCDLKQAGDCQDQAKLVKTGKEPGVLSPDRKQEAFIRNWNLWVRDVATGKET
ncbi:MAG TPA: DPP IV N-terminal domain-containing protein, partial [Dyella sp.]|nr:DPP IV N-terminal domain-containing protein [Dyella sp.]